MTRPRGDRRPRPADPLIALLTYLSEIEQAVLNRNWNQLAASLRRRWSSHLPREVREELVLLSRSSRSSMRAPVQFLRYQHRMTQLAATAGSMPNAQTELDLSRGRAARRPADGRRVAARRSKKRSDDADGPSAE